MKNWVLFRFPEQTDIHFIGSDSTKEINTINLSELNNGFILRPFDINKPSAFISNEESCINPDNDFLNSLNFHTKDGEDNSTPKNHYISYVKQSVEAINNNQFQKVVPAKIKSINTQIDKEKIISAFKNACDKYPNAFVSLSSTEKWGTWLGATPEKLISINSTNILETVALAGTQLSNGKLPSEAVWTQKEIEEQALVSRFIIGCFKQIRLREFEENGPKTIKAGNLLHLKTEYSIDLNMVDFDDLGTTLLDLLHPTSAICGMPKKDALDFIRKNEDFDRQLYAGFIGPINYQKESHLFVNLRTAQLNKNSINLYAGAGVTADSNPEKEWIETENKLNIIGGLFNT